MTQCSTGWVDKEGFLEAPAMVRRGTSGSAAVPYCFLTDAMNMMHMADASNVSMPETKSFFRGGLSAAWRFKTGLGADRVRR